MSGRKPWHHEPFNAQRPFHWIVRNFKQDAEHKSLSSDMEEALKDSPCIKHCYDLLPVPIHKALLEVAANHSYSFVILDRRNDLDRVLSLQLAQQTGAWGPSGAKERYPEILAGRIKLEPISAEKVRSALETGRNRRAMLKRQLSAHGKRPHVVLFEEVYGDPSVGVEKVAGLMEFLGVDVSANSDYESALNQTLTGTSQNSASILEHVPNIAELREQFSSFSDVGGIWDDLR
ncbi:hypothetical protein [Aliiruegeria haliotis]|nr:hypothetical protein [Aliiruegeria haliotis]